MKEQKPKCRKCGGECNPSTALNNAIAYGEPDISGNRQVFTDMPSDKLIGCLKCEKCGHSFVEPKPEATGEAIYGPNPTDEVELYLSPDEELIESIGSELEYFKARCEAAEAVIELCEDVTVWAANPELSEQVEAYAKWQALKNQQPK